MLTIMDLVRPKDLFESSFRSETVGHATRDFSPWVGVFLGREIINPMISSASAVKRNFRSRRSVLGDYSSDAKANSECLHQWINLRNIIKISCQRFHIWSAGPSREWKACPNLILMYLFNIFFVVTFFSPPWIHTGPSFVWEVFTWVRSNVFILWWIV